MDPSEKFNAGSHLAGLCVAVACAAAWFWVHSARWDWLTLCGLVAFALTTALLYAASTLCHATVGPLRLRWERLDHGAVFLLIVGTYTPFALTAPRHAENLVILAVLWVAGLWWFAVALSTKSKPHALRFVVLGWFAVLAAVPVAMRADPNVLPMLLGGAVAYSVGTIFYVRPGIWVHAHGIWHLFVLLGTASHYGSVYHLLA